MADLVLTELHVREVKRLDVFTGYSGLAFPVGTVVQLDPTTGKFVKATDDPFGIALTKASNANEAITVLRKGLLTIGQTALAALSFGDRVYLSKAVAGAMAGAISAVNEIQTVTITATEGTFTLAFGAATTGNLAYNATAATVQSALEGLATVGAGNITVAGSAGGPYTVTFRDALVGNVAALVASATGLAGGTAVVATSTAGTTPNVIAKVVPGWANGATASKLLSVDL